VAPTRLSTSQFLDAIAWPNIYANGSQDYYAQDELAALEAAKQARLDRLIAGEGRAADRAALERLQTAHLRHSDLGLLVSAIDEGPNTTLPAPTNSNRTAIHVFEDGFASLLAYEQGLCRASILQGGSFDTHVDHDSSHPNQLQCLIQAIDLLMQEAISRALPVVFLVTSEFGRTSGYNVADGKDHWPVTSWMMLQTPGLNLFQGGREVGATILDPTTGVTVYRDLDITSLAVGDPAGESPLTPELLHVGLRRLLNIDTHPLADHNYPLPGPDVSRLFSG
jgi:hypothetical protein